jgi:hypothetical protein
VRLLRCCGSAAASKHGVTIPLVPLYVPHRRTMSAGSVRSKVLSDMARAESRPVQVPPHLIERINELVRTSQRMLTEIGRQPTAEELAERLAMPVERVHRLLEIAKARWLPF